MGGRNLNTSQEQLIISHWGIFVHYISFRNVNGKQWHILLPFIN